MMMLRMTRMHACTNRGVLCAVGAADCNNVVEES